MISRAWHLLLLMAGISFVVTGCARDQYVATPDGVMIAYDYRQAASEKGAVILLHGLGANYGSWDSLTSYLVKNGWSTLALDLRGHGLSTRWLNEEIDWRGFSNDAYATMLRDVETVRKVLGERQPLWMIGASLGANLGLAYAAQTPEVDGLVLLTAGTNYGGFEAEPALDRLGMRPVFYVASEGDWAAAKVAERLASNTQGPNAVKVYKDAGHGSEMLAYEKDLKEEILEWMNRHSA